MFERGLARTRSVTLPYDVMSPTARRRVYGLCGQPFVNLIPDGDQETERDKLCGACAMLPPSPKEDEERS